MTERNIGEENIKRMERRNCFSFAYSVLFVVEKEKKRNEMKWETKGRSVCLSNIYREEKRGRWLEVRKEEFMRKRLEKDEILIGEWGPFPPKDREKRLFAF